MAENTSDSRLCVACATELNDHANVCPACHVDQRKKYRNLKRIVGVFSGVSVILGVITIAVSLYPNAVRFLFPEEKIDIYALESYKVAKEEVIAMTVVNTGNVDLFLNKVVFEAVDQESYPLVRRFVTNKWVKYGEAYIHKGLAITAVNTRSFFTPMNAERFSESYRHVGDFDNHKYCFKIVVLDDEFDDKGRVPIKISSIPVEATLYYSSKDRDSVEKFKSNKKLRGQIFFREVKVCKDWIKKEKLTIGPR